MRRTHTRALPWVLLCAYAIAHTHARKKERRGKFIRKEGQGTSRGKGGTYEGHYKSGRRDGYGTMRYTSGDLYAGMWRHGLGIALLAHLCERMLVEVSLQPRC